MNLSVQTYGFNNYTNNSYKNTKTNFKGVTQILEKKIVNKNNNIIKTSLLVLGASVLSLFKAKEKDKPLEVSTQDLIDIDVKKMINNQKDAMRISKNMRKILREKDYTKEETLKDSRKVVASIYQKNKALITKNLNLILNNEKYENLPKGYYHRLKTGLYSLLEWNPDMFTLNEKIVDWKIDVLKAEDQLN